MDLMCAFFENSLWSPFGKLAAETAKAKSELVSNFALIDNFWLELQRLQ